MVAIWALVVGNLVVHEILRPEPWSTAVRAAGYALTALTVGAFFQCVTTHPGSVPEAWRAAALEGNELCVLHHSTGEPVPPRGRYYRRYGETLLAFDHHCWWIGRPIGLLNRKFFVLFVLYAASLSGFGMVVSASDLKETLALPGTNGSMSDTLALLSPFAFGAIGGPSAQSRDESNRSAPCPPSATSATDKIGPSNGRSACAFRSPVWRE